MSQGCEGNEKFAEEMFQTRREDSRERRFVERAKNGLEMAKRI